MSTWLLLFTLGAGLAQITQGCETECPDGYLMICVEGDEDCKCSCVASLEEGESAVRRLLGAVDVSEDAIEDVIREYRKNANAYSHMYIGRSVNFSIRFENRSGEQYKLNVIDSVLLIEQEEILIALPFPGSASP